VLKFPHIRSTFSGCTGFGGVSTAGVTGGSTATTGREPGAVWKCSPFWWLGWENSYKNLSNGGSTLGKIS